MSDSDVCGGNECCKMRPTQAMDDSGITQVLGLLSEPSPQHGRKGEGVGVMGRGREEERPASCVEAGIPRGSPGPLSSTSQLLLCLPMPATSEDYLLFSGT